MVKFYNRLVKNAEMTQNKGNDERCQDKNGLKSLDKP